MEIINADIEGHLDYLKKVCLDLEAQLIVEFGVRDGGSTKAFLEVAPILGARVISVDIEDCSEVANSPLWTFYQMDDLFFDIDEPIDVLFIDTSHTYQQTIKELRKFAPKAKVILLHDTEHCPEVKEAITDYLNECPGYTFENFTHCNGLGVLWPKRQ